MLIGRLYRNQIFALRHDDAETSAFNANTRLFMLLFCAFFFFSFVHLIKRSIGLVLESCVISTILTSLAGDYYHVDLGGKRGSQLFETYPCQIDVYNGNFC